MERTSVPYITTTSGISATDGIGRRNSIVEAVIMRTIGMLPMMRPRTMPAMIAMDSPIAQPRRVSPSADQKSDRCASSASLPKISDRGGR